MGDGEERERERVVEADGGAEVGEEDGRDQRDRAEPRDGVPRAEGALDAPELARLDRAVHRLEHGEDGVDRRKVRGGERKQRVLVRQLVQPGREVAEQQEVRADGAVVPLVRERERRLRPREKAQRGRLVGARRLDLDVAPLRLLDPDRRPVRKPPALEDVKSFCRKVNHQGRPFLLRHRDGFLLSFRVHLDVFSSEVFPQVEIWFHDPYTRNQFEIKLL